MEEKYQDHEISGVKFEDTGYQAVKYYREMATPKIIKLVMKYSGGAIKEERQAEYALLGLILVAIVLAFIIWPSSSSLKLSPEEIQKIKESTKVQAY